MMKRLFFIAMLFAPIHVSAQIIITEVMYDPQGSDTGREWIEIQNQSGTAETFTTWKLFEENVNHKINATDAATTIPAGGYAILVTDKAKFLADFPNVTVPIFDTSFSLKNTSENLVLKDPNGNIADQYLYDTSLGAADDGRSLQLLGSSWVASTPTPGVVNNASTQTTPSPDTTATTTPPVIPPTSSATTTTATSTTTISETTPTQNNTQSLPTSAQFASSPTLLPPPQLYATIIGPKFVVAGVETAFEGKAFNREKKQVGETVYGWNFGDGATAIGMKVQHRYKYPGTYYIALDASAGDTTTVEYMTVQVIAPQMQVTPHLDENNVPYITVLNTSVYDVDISNWVLQVDGTYGTHFVIPKNTHVIPGGEILFPSEVTKLDATSTDVALLFPNTRVADTYQFHDADIDQEETAAVPPEEKVAVKNISTQTIEHRIIQDVIEPQKVEASDERGEIENAATSTQAALAVTANTEENSSVWYGAMIGLVVIASGALWFVRSNALEKLSKADEYEIVEE